MNIKISVIFFLLQTQRYFDKGSKVLNSIFFAYGKVILKSYPTAFFKNSFGFIVLIFCLIKITESYNLHHDLLTLECRVRGTPKPHIQWMKDGDYIIPGDKYEQHELPDGICKLVIRSPDPEEDSGTYTCEAECNGCSDSISHNVQYEGQVETQFNRVHRYYHRDPLKPYFKSGLMDANVPSGGSIAIFVETQANCEVEWYRDRWIVDHKPPKRFVFNDGNGFFACVINHATMDESAKYTAKATNPYGTSQSSAFIDIINPNQVGKGQKPPIFITRPQPEIKIRAGDPFSMSFRVQGEPKPRSNNHCRLVYDFVNSTIFFFIFSSMVQMRKGDYERW